MAWEPSATWNSNTFLPGYIVSSFVIMFSIAPLFDLHAPAAYIESMQFLLIILTIMLEKMAAQVICVLSRDGVVIYLLLLCTSYHRSQFSGSAAASSSSISCLLYSDGSSSQG